MLAGEVPTAAHLPALAKGADYWEVGRDCYDMALAVKHVANIVRSVRQLGGGGGEGERRPDVQLLETIEQALTLLQSPLRRINLQLALQPLPPLPANETEWVQIWVNLIKNGCDALAQTQAPTIWIRSGQDEASLCVITSYSIHYTKLYEPIPISGRACWRPFVPGP